MEKSNKTPLYKVKYDRKYDDRFKKVVFRLHKQQDKYLIDFIEEISKLEEKSQQQILRSFVESAYQSNKAS